MATERAPVRVSPPSAADETRRVLKLGFIVLYGAAFVVLGRPLVDEANVAVESPFEVRFQALDASDQRMFRNLQEGVLEAEYERSRSGKWPDAKSLAESGIPPFATDPIDQAKYQWRSLSSDNLVNYIGSPAQSDRPTLIAIITEPPPGTAPDPRAIVDETHHKLQDGTIIHVTIWFSPAPKGGEGPPLQDLKEPIAFVNEQAGWRRVTSVAPTR